MYMFCILFTNKRWLQEKSLKQNMRLIGEGRACCRWTRNSPGGQEDKQPLRTINKDCRLMKPPGIKEQQFIGKTFNRTMTKTPHN